jgi:branched-chain amino acid aminotransferase
VHRSGFGDACVFMCGTRGPYRGGAFLGDPRDCNNGFYAYAVPYYYVVPRECVETGAHIWIAETRRAPLYATKAYSHPATICLKE